MQTVKGIEYFDLGPAGSDRPAQYQAEVLRMVYGGHWIEHDGQILYHNEGIYDENHLRESLARATAH